VTPNDILSVRPNGLVCSDCNAPSPEVTDTPMPQCARCYAVTHTQAALNWQTCTECSYSYNGDEWDACPNDDCIVNLANDPEAYDFDGPEPDDLFDMEDEG